MDGASARAETEKRRDESARESERERGEETEAQWRLSDITEQISKIAPQRPGLQHGYHGDPTTGAINSLSVPNLVRLEQLQKEDRQTDGDGEKEDRGEKRKAGTG